jgi:hypothetical protein
VTAKQGTTPNPSIKDDELYRDHRRVAAALEMRGLLFGVALLAQHVRPRRRLDLRQFKKRAKELGMSGYSSLTKVKLSSKLRHH